MTLSTRSVVAVALVACFAPFASQAGAQVVEFDAFKVEAYQQTAADTQPTTPILWDIDSWNKVTNPGDYIAANINGTLDLTFEFDAWEGAKDYASLAALEAEFPEFGSYTINMIGGTESSVSQTVTLGANDFPTTVPYLTGTSFDDLQGMTSSLPIDLTVNTVASAGADGGFFEVCELLPGDVEGDCVFEIDLGSIQSIVTIPAGTMIAGKQYRAIVGFTNIDSFPSDPSGFNLPSIVGYDTLTVANFTTMECPADLNGDGVVDGMDLAGLLAAWGGCP